MEHTIDPARVHHGWDRTLEPVLQIASGDIVHYDLRMAGHDQIAEGDGYAEARLDFDTLYHLSGPVFVEGATPGDTLRIEILELEPGDWGWASVLPGLVLLDLKLPKIDGLDAQIVVSRRVYSEHGRTWRQLWMARSESLRSFSCACRCQRNNPSTNA